MKPIKSPKKGILLGVLLLLVPIIFAYGVYSRIASNLNNRPRVGSAFPLFNVQNLDGKLISSIDLIASKRTAVVFVKPGCPNCKRMLGLLSRDPEVRSGALELAAISLAPPSEVQRHRTEDGFTGRLFSDVDHAFHRQAGGLGTPLAFLVDERGRISEILDGVKNEAVVRAALHNLVGNPHA